MRLLAIASIALGLSMTPVLAGDAVMVRSADGMQLKIKCKNSGCKVTGKAKDASKWGTVEKGKGGTKNYEALVAKYAAMGFVES